VVYDGQGQKMPILAVIGINPAGQRSVLAFTVGERENQEAWEDLLSQLKARGVQSVGLWISDGHQAMLNAIAVKFPNAPRQRGVNHKMDNVLSYIPHSQRDQVEPELRAIFYQHRRAAADQAWLAFCEKYRPLYPTAIECLQRDGEARLTFYAFPTTRNSKVCGRTCST
jgi:transposase-like protein